MSTTTDVSLQENDLLNNNEISNISDKIVIY